MMQSRVKTKPLLKDMKTYSFMSALICAVLFLVSGCCVDGESAGTRASGKNVNDELKGALQGLVSGIDAINAVSLAEEGSYANISSFKAKIQKCLENIADGNEARAVSEYFLDLLLINDDIVAADYYLLWLGNTVLSEYPSADVKKWHRLAYKANNATCSLGHNIHAEWRMMVADLLSEVEDNAGR